MFPYLDFQHCLNKAVDTYKYDLFTCGDSKGLESLRHTLVSHLAGDQVFAKAEQIFVTSGVNQALEILAKMPFPNGNSVILVEQLSYDIYMRFLEAEGIPVCGIARTTAGLDMGNWRRNSSMAESSFSIPCQDTTVLSVPHTAQTKGKRSPVWRTNTMYTS
ncbi:aminotransferase class I/II-fold pyridoxal phosphate-dependent enzyme [Paenibacillus sp. P26]|nr:aminotransferase class I/II-fold pyridoxal phosphate-dependent enzyme [Paenibacillus sp. P26]